MQRSTCRGHAQYHSCARWHELGAMSTTMSSSGMLNSTLWLRNVPTQAGAATSKCSRRRARNNQLGACSGAGALTVAAACAPRPSLLSGAPRTAGPLGIWGVREAGWRGTKRAALAQAAAVEGTCPAQPICARPERDENLNLSSCEPYHDEKAARGDSRSLHKARASPFRRPSCYLKTCHLEE